jgi:hypothetical protein
MRQEGQWPVLVDSYGPQHALTPNRTAANLLSRHAKSRGPPLVGLPPAFFLSGNRRCSLAATCLAWTKAKKRADKNEVFDMVSAERKNFCPRLRAKCHASTCLQCYCQPLVYRSFGSQARCFPRKSATPRGLGWSEQALGLKRNRLLYYANTRERPARGRPAVGCSMQITADDFVALRGSTTALAVRVCDPSIWLAAPRRWIQRVRLGIWNSR